MTIAIVDCASGVAGDMLLGALVDCGLDAAFVEALPGVLGLPGVTVRQQRVLRAGISAHKVDFDIPPQPHGRHLRHLRAILREAALPDAVRATADRVFTRLTEVEASIHGTTVEQVHLHEVGAVDAILDVVGTVWGLHLLGVERIYNTPVSLGDGFVQAAHGRMAVPTPATLRLLEGFAVRSGPEGSGELATPTGAALLAALSQGAAPAEWVPIRQGYGAGTKDFADRANVVRVVLARAAGGAAPGRETVMSLVCDVDDATGEELAAAAAAFRAAGALDVVLTPTVMKKGRPGVRVEVLAAPADADRLERMLFTGTPTIGVRRVAWERAALPRREATVQVFGHPVRCKVITLPDGTARAKPEDDDVRAVVAATGASRRAVVAEVTQALSNPTS